MKKTAARKVRLATVHCRPKGGKIPMGNCKLFTPLIEEAAEKKAGHLVYNVAALIGPDGSIASKYRKVALPREEIERGVAPGHDYPVFDTRFG